MDISHYLDNLRDDTAKEVLMDSLETYLDDAESWELEREATPADILADAIGYLEMQCLGVYVEPSFRKALKALRKLA